MPWSDLLFSFHGRINRGRYWLAAVLQACAFAIALVLLLLVAAGMDFSDGGKSVPLVLIALAAFYLVLLYSMVAVAVKRLHDRERPGWWVIVFYVIPALINGGARAGGNTGGFADFALVSLALSVWGLIELGFLRGTDGPNVYGPDPRAPASPPAG